MSDTLVICPDDCDFSLPPVSFGECNPEVNLSQIAKIYLAKPQASAFTDVTDINEWNARLSETDTGANAIRPIIVIGDKPLPEKTERTISGGRTVVTDKKHVVNFDIDETNAQNHDFVRNTKCIKSVKFWYETIGGLLFGGNTGINGTLEVDMALSRTEGDIIVYPGTLRWSSRDLENRDTSPLA